MVDTAASLADAVGLESLTLASIASELGVRLPSLYKHIAGMPALQRQLAIRAKLALTAELAGAAVGRSRGDAVSAVCVAYRRWALAHPGLYPATTRAPDRDDAEDMAASQASVQVVFDILRGYGLEDDALIDATRSLRAALHGFISLENGQGFGMDRSVDASFESMVSMLEAWLMRTDALD